ncbi:MAG TPA: hypothetical protein DD738_11325 [Ruminiclostridium sp.]|nr:hypothetical protein [Ruminiclostridium sp.]
MNYGADCNALAWSPDGEKIAFISSIPHCPATIQVMNSVGSDPETLTRSPIRSYALTWSPLIRL